MRKVLSWGIVILSTIIIYKSINYILDFMNVTTYINLDEPVMIYHSGNRYEESWEELVEGYSTMPGQAICLLSMIFGIRVGMAINYGKISGGISSKENIDFFAIVIGIILFSALDEVIRNIFYDYTNPGIGLIERILSLASLYIIYKYIRRYRNIIISKIDNK